MTKKDAYLFTLGRFWRLLRGPELGGGVGGAGLSLDLRQGGLNNPILDGIQHDLTLNGIEGDFQILKGFKCILNFKFPAKTTKVKQHREFNVDFCFISVSLQIFHFQGN